jgi:hypothetical protein
MNDASGCWARASNWLSQPPTGTRIDNLYRSRILTGSGLHLVVDLGGDGARIDGEVACANHEPICAEVRNHHLTIIPSAMKPIDTPSVSTI